jgi:hypothetical protein
LIVAYQRGYYQGQKLPKGRTTGGGKKNVEVGDYESVGWSARTAKVKNYQRVEWLAWAKYTEVKNYQRVVWTVWVSRPRLELQKGGYAGSQRRTMIGLDHRLGLTPRKCG